MRISLVAAMGPNQEIGKDNQLLWHISEDLKNFKRLTLNKPILMGRKTYESIGRALPHRLNIVLTRRPDFSAPGVLTIHSLDELKVHLKNDEELMVIGGGEVYRLMLPMASRLYLSKVDYRGDADTFFPEFNEKEWKVLESQDFKESGNSPAWKFEIWERTF